MDNIERTMQFILDMEAKHEVWLQKHEEAIVKINEDFGRINAAIEANTTRIGQLVDVSLSLTHALEETGQRMEAGFREMREAQADTNYKLNALIETVDKIVRNGHKHES